MINLKGEEILPLSVISYDHNVMTHSAELVDKVIGEYQARIVELENMLSGSYVKGKAVTDANGQGVNYRRAGELNRDSPVVTGNDLRTILAGFHKKITKIATPEPICLPVEYRDLCKAVGVKPDLGMESVFTMAADKLNAPQPIPVHRTKEFIELAAMVGGNDVLPLSIIRSAVNTIAEQNKKLRDGPLFSSIKKMAETMCMDGPTVNGVDVVERAIYYLDDVFNPSASIEDITQAEINAGKLPVTLASTNQQSLVEEFLKVDPIRYDTDQAIKIVRGLYD